jgi:hypothetical protein
MVFQTIRNFFAENILSKTLERSRYDHRTAHDQDPFPSDSDFYLRHRLEDLRDYDLEAQLDAVFLDNQKTTFQGYQTADKFKGEPYEFYMDIDPSEIPQSRLSAPGIQTLPIRLHSEQVVSATPEVPESGFPLHPALSSLIYARYPQYAEYTTLLTRPLGTTDATFNDFNKEQKEYPPIPYSLSFLICSIIAKLLNASAFLPLHFIDVFHTGLPVRTGASYFYRHSYLAKTHAAFSHPDEYHSKPTSKGYFINFFSLWARRITHNIKQFGLPFSPEKLSPSQIRSRLRDFFISHSTMLFTRNHISERSGNLKQRPVYAMDTLFIHIESMLTYPLHVMARSMSSSIMYSIETIRGGCSYMDSRARAYSSFLCIDWSSFDQRMPWIIVDTFFTIFLPTLLIISAGYQPTAEYMSYPDLTSTDMFQRLFNLICFLRTWYYNCVFATADGYAYVRTLAGIASGMLNTQYLDSFCNLFTLVHALLHFGCTQEEIFQLVLFVMGDDNVILSPWSSARLHSFFLFLESHALSRFGMVLSPTKSIFTTLRSKIEMLGYTCNNGNPTRRIDKLVAQLCYPEHGYKNKYMSSRAIGMAYASAGQDLTFHTFCRDVYLTFLPYALDEPNLDLEMAKRFLPGTLRYVEDLDDLLNVERFPTIHEVLHRYQSWQGPLPMDKKWNPAHFINAPDCVPPSSVSMYDYMSQNDIQFPDVERLFI